MVHLSLHMLGEVISTAETNHMNCATVIISWQSSTRVHHWVMSLNYRRYKLKLAKTANVIDVQNEDIKNGEGSQKNQWRIRN